MNDYIYPSYLPTFDEEKLREILFCIASNNSGIFHCKRIAKKSSFSAQSIAHYMTYLVRVDAVKVFDKKMFPDGSRTRQIYYQRNFRPEDINKLIVEMKEVDFR